MNKNWCLIAAVAAVCVLLVFSSDAFGQRTVQLRAPEALPQGTQDGGTSGQAGCDAGDVVYRNVGNSGYFYRPFPSYIDADDVKLQRTGADLQYYEVRTVALASLGCVAPAGFNPTIGLWTDTLGDPDLGEPQALIPGTECTINVPVCNVTTVMQCKVAPGIVLPSGLWITYRTDTTSSGWNIANAAPGEIGASQDYFAEDDYPVPSGWIFTFFGGCPVCGSMRAQIVLEGGTFGACCNTTTFACTNTYECDCLGDTAGTNAYTENVLCNNLATPCSEGGACCDTLTGVCTASFASLCDGYLQEFTAGADCSSVTCDTPDNVPTVTQWGMIALTVLMLTGLTVKFGRRRTVTA
jgi:hypothetical protein